jgi:hypothetical protein
VAQCCVQWQVSVLAVFAFSVVSATKELDCVKLCICCNSEHWLVTVEARVQSQNSLCRISSGQSGTGEGFPFTTSCSLANYRSTNVS